ncbi:GMC family oxidoreductase [Pseudonocardia xinjiangensis]|uniref:GMC family oxidoreductase n=1 Tax=Pseudonocardia xinjiangensis TaxID=75289 RepID=UPI001B7D1EC8|nr:GMC family oxidoreductase N-terminal domain-containing protein [Pseudonocardia xinjiangensis]
MPTSVPSSTGVPPEQDDRPFDHIIVGGGAAGSVLAARLSADPGCRVLLLEAGPADDDPRIEPPHGLFGGLLRGELDWSYDTVPQEQLGGRTVPISAGRVLGGGGSINYQAWYRGHPFDYDGWAASGMTGWSWEEVLPAFRRSEDHELGASALHGVGGPIPVTTPEDVSPLSLAFIAAGVEYGLPLNRDFNGERLDGVGLLYSNVRDGERHSAARAYLRPAADRPNLVVRTRAFVRRVLLDGRRATGVRYSDALGQSFEVHADSVTLAAGAVRTPQLLMLSGIGPADHLREHGIEVIAHVPGVGANLQDHPSALIGWPVVRGATWLDALSDRNQALYAQERRGPLASIGQAGAFLRCGAGAEAPDIELTPMLIDLLGNSVPGFSCLVTLLKPESRGSVRLASTDPEAAPVIDARYLESATDRTLVVEGLRRTLELCDSPIMRALIGPASFPASTDHASLLESARASLISTNHPVGTCRAGIDGMSVVDPALRVHGVTGLRVVDASIMPTIPRGNTHAPSVMIGERAAELIGNEQGRSPRPALPSPSPVPEGS